MLVGAEALHMVQEGAEALPMCGAGGHRGTSLMMQGRGSVGCRGPK